jgi:type II secretory pathway pseudopilin PulG
MGFYKKPKDNAMKIKKTKGYTLIEILLVTGFIAVATIGVYTIFNKAKDISIANDEAKIVDHFRTEIARMYENSPSYTGLDNIAVNTAKVTPINMTTANPNEIFNKFGGTVTINPITYSGVTDSGFRITYPNIRIASCSYMVLSLMGGFNSITVNGTVVKNYGDGAVNPAILATACSNASNAVGATINFDYISSFLITAASAVPARLPKAGTIFSIPNTDLVCDIDSTGFWVGGGPTIPANIRSQMIFTFKSIDNYSGRCPTQALYNTWINNLNTQKAANPGMSYQDVYTNIITPLIINDGVYNHTKSTEENIATGFCNTQSTTVYGAAVASSYVPGSGNKCKVN